MVLVPVGESEISISINGTERVNELISDDTSYNLTESQNVTINIDGSQKASQNITSDTTFNGTAQVNGNKIQDTGSISNNKNGGPKDKTFFNDVFNVSNASTVDYQLNTASAGTRSTLWINGNKEAEAQDGNNKSGTYTGSASKIRIDTYNQENYETTTGEVTAYFDLYESDSVSADVTF